MLLLLLCYFSFYTLVEASCYSIRTNNVRILYNIAHMHACLMQLLDPSDDRAFFSLYSRTQLPMYQERDSNGVAWSQETQLQSHKVVLLSLDIIIDVYMRN